MREVIYTLLQKVKGIQLPPYDQETIHLRIPQQTPIAPAQMEEGESYIVQLASYIVKPPPGFTLADEWNKGVVPQQANLKVTVVSKQGKMLNLDCFEPVSGVLLYQHLWIPQKGIISWEKCYD